MSVNSRLSSDLALTEINSESALEVTQAVCNDFTGDMCPIGKDASFLYLHLCNVLYIANDHELHTANSTSKWKMIECVCMRVCGYGSVLQCTRFEIKQ